MDQKSFPAMLNTIVGDDLLFTATSCNDKHLLGENSQLAAPGKVKESNTTGCPCYCVVGNCM